jgi:hypothetical protein
MTTFKQLTKDGVVKRKDAMQVRYADIVVNPAFNKREHGERLQAHIQALFQFIMGGGQVPDLEVIPVDGGKVQVVDGHSRHAAFGMAIAAGKDIEYIGVKPFNGDDADRTARIATSNEGLKLTPLETARVYRALRDEHDLGPEDIARKVHKTRQHVDQLLHLADAAPAVQQMVADGTVSATEAMKVARKHGDGAAQVLGQAAAAAGKVTAKALKPWTPPARYVAPLVQTVDQLVDKVPSKVREELLAMEKNGTLNTAQVAVQLPAAVLFQLLDQQFGINEERAKAVEKAREKEGKAAQGELTA